MVKIRKKNTIPTCFDNAQCTHKEWAAENQMTKNRTPLTNDLSFKI